MKKINKILSMSLLVTPLLSGCGLKVGNFDDYHPITKEVNGINHEFYVINDHYYEFVSMDKDMKEGKIIKYIETLGGHVFTCETEEEYAFILAYSKAKKVHVDLGLFKKPHTKDWVWATGEKATPTYKQLKKFLKHADEEADDKYGYVSTRGFSEFLTGHSKGELVPYTTDFVWMTGGTYLIEWECEDDIYGSKKYNFFPATSVHTEDEFIAAMNTDNWAGISIENDITFTKQLYFNSCPTIDGKNHTLKFADNASGGNGTYVFNELAKGEIVENLTIDHNVITDSNADGISGFIAGLHGTLSNVTFKGSVIRTSEGTSKRTGGIISKLYKNARLINVVNEADVTGHDDVGGIFAFGAENGIQQISKCTNKGHIKGGAAVGGIGGKIEITKSISVDNLKNEGTVEGSQETGGIVGRFILVNKTTNACDPFAESISISNCDNTGTISAIGYVGGCFGYLHGECNSFLDLEKTHCDIYLNYVTNHGLINGNAFVYDSEYGIGNVVGIFYVDGSDSSMQSCGVEGVYNQNKAIAKYISGSQIL